MWRLEKTWAYLTLGRDHTLMQNSISPGTDSHPSTHIYSSASLASGHRFYYLKGAAALLELALIQYAMQKAVARVSRSSATHNNYIAPISHGANPSVYRATSQ